MAQLPPQRVPLTKGDLIEREWLRFFSELASTSATVADLTALTAAVAAIQAAYLTADVAMQTEIDALELALGALPSQDALFLRRPGGIQPESELMFIRSMGPRQTGAQPSDTQALFAARSFGV